MLQMSIYNTAEFPDNSFVVDGSSYTLRVDNTEKDNQIILLTNSQGEELIRYEYNNLFNNFSEADNGKEFLPTEKLTFRQENEQAAITIIANYVSLNEWSEGQETSADLIILIDIR